MNPKELMIDALPLIRQFAPTIAHAIGGPLGMAVGYVIPVLSQVFETPPSDIKSLASKILTDPQAEERLKSIEDKHGDFINALLDNINDLATAEITIKLTWEPNK